MKSWLKTLNIEIRPSNLCKVDHNRTIQLINKTNQLNLSSRRLNLGELTKWLSLKNNFFYTYRVSDRIGDSGLTGIASFSIIEDKGEIVDFILSCRVAGKDVEDAMIFHIIKVMKERGVAKAFFTYSKTNYNKPIYDILKRTKLKLESNNIFTWNLIDDYPKPETNILISKLNHHTIDDYQSSKR